MYFKKYILCLMLKFLMLKFLLKVFHFCVQGLMTSKKDSASESTLSLPPGEELKTVTEKDGNIPCNLCFSKLNF